MAIRKSLAALGAVGLLLSSVVATPVFAQDELDEDAGLWLMGGFVVAEAILVAILASEDGPEQVPNPPPPVSP